MAKLRKNAVIYDFETLSQNPLTGPVINMAMLQYDETRFQTNPYTFQELVNEAALIKFDIKEQIEKYGRIIQKETMDWWLSQDEEIRRFLKPSDKDRSIRDLAEFCLDEAPVVDVVYTRGNTFDPVYMTSLNEAVGNSDPWPWWLVRDTRSFIEGATIGCDVKNTFDPPNCEGFIHHDPIHDIAKDVMRMQYLVSSLLGNNK